MTKFPARTPRAQQLPDAVKREVRFLAQALDGMDPSVVEVRAVLDPIVGLERNEKAFAHVFPDLFCRNVAAGGGNVDGDAFRRGVWKRALNGVAHAGLLYFYCLRGGSAFGVLTAIRGLFTSYRQAQQGSLAMMPVTD
jgi:hypothetical protein